MGRANHLTRISRSGIEGIGLTLHWNPLEVNFVEAYDPMKQATVKKKRKMGWADAAKVSAVITVALLFVDFLMGYKTIPASNEVPQFLWSLFVFLGKTFFATFLALTGLAQYAASKKGEE